MKHGDKVLAICTLGKQRKETKHQGIFLREEDGKFICKISGQEIALTAEQVSRYEPIDQDVLEEKCKQEFHKLADTIKQACEKLLLPEQRGNIKLNEEELTIELLNGSVIVSPAPFRQNCIGVVREAAGWSVGVLVTYPGTRLDPPDWDIKEQGTRVGDLNVARLVVETIFKDTVTEYFLCVQDDRMTQDWKEFE